MLNKSKTGLFAVGFFIFASVFILISFVCPYWLVTDGQLKEPKFLKIGLWEVCFNGFKDVHHWYDTVFTGCWWIFEEEYYIIHDTLLPGFFIATQFFFTITMCCVIISIFLLVIYMRKERDDDNYVTLLVTLGTILVIGGFSGLISVVTFGAQGDGRDWMPNWEHNDLGWAYAVGVIGVIFLFPGAILFLVEARVQKYKKLHEMQSRDPSSYTMHERKVGYTGGHTDI
ncbi:hypothetical protein ACJJTC_009811 [Scirpophaga incertulas]